MRESKIETYLKKRVKALKGQTRKVKWIGRSQAPDRLVLLPGRHFLAELKATGKKARKGQLREHNRLRDSGMQVFIINSEHDVDWVLGHDLR